MTFEGQYLTYAEYQVLGGSAIGEMPFNLLEFEARKRVDSRTYGRLKKLSNQIQEVKLCVNKLINVLKGYAENDAKNKGVSSESIDGYSITYINNIELTKAQKAEVKDIIETYLDECKLNDGTPYLYRG